jgi:hypothetical protein
VPDHAVDDGHWWEHHYGTEHDPSGLSSRGTSPTMGLWTVGHPATVGQGEYVGKQATARVALAVGLLVTTSALGCGDGETVGTAPTTSPPSTTVQSTTTSAPEPTITTTTVTELAIDPDGVRYLDLVFESIETVSDVVYWPDAPPLAEGDAPVADLTMDLYLPAGDTLTERPVIIAFESGRGSWLVDDFVRRGYVVAVPSVRGRPNTPGLEALLDTRQGLVDGAAAVRWLRANADTYGLHPHAFAASGVSGAGILSLALAWGQSNSPEVTELDLFGVITVPIPGELDFGDHHIDQPSTIAAAFPLVAWYPPELVGAGEPPVIMFNGTRDTTYPFEAVEQICPAAHAVGVICEFRPFQAGHSLRDYDSVISEEAAAFLHEQVLSPLGVVAES